MRTRAALAVHPLPIAVLLTAALCAQAPITPLVGTVLDPAGQPAAAAVVTVARCDGRLFKCLDLQLRAEWVEIARTKTDRSGRFGLQVPLGLALRVTIDLPPYAIWSSDAIVTGTDQQVQLEAAATLTGRLVDAETGESATGALRLRRAGTSLDLGAGRTAADGSFRFERLPSGRCTIAVEPDVLAQPDWIDCELAAGAIHTTECRCPTGVTLSGKVMTATGQPIAGARIGEGWTFAKAVRSDADGNYTLRGVGGQGPVLAVHADAPGHAVQRHDVPLAQPPAKLDLVLAAGVRVVGRILAHDGRPVANAYVAAITSTDLEIPWLATRSAADGQFVCDGFPRRGDGVLMVRCAGHASVVYSLPRAAADGQIDFPAVRLPPPQVVRGIARDADGQPAAGVEISLRGVNADFHLYAGVPSAWALLQNYCADRVVRTDHHGAFAFGDVAPGEYGVAFGSMTEATAATEIVTVKAGEETRALVLER
jgi:hypothetical protein